MKLEATLTQGEIPILVKNQDGDMVPNPEYPADLGCKSGHIAPPGTRFFAVSGQVVPQAVAGVYCELCLQVANRMARHGAQKEPVPFDPADELQRLMGASDG